MTASTSSYATGGLTRTGGRRTKVGLVAGGLGAYWPQFPDLLPQLQRSAAQRPRRLCAPPGAT